MDKDLFISEKPSVAKEFSKALKDNFINNDGYMESENKIITWCVGHLITMSYPEAYDETLKKWSSDTLPFLPKSYKYEVISSVKKQFDIVKKLLKRKDVSRIYVCTDSGREGEYIYRLVDSMANVGDDKEKRRVWIDSQTEEEILRGIKEAKLLSEYDNLSASAYLRAKEDYLMGINFSRILSIKYGQVVNNSLNSKKWNTIAVGRVMTCVLGMVVRREREIRSFVKTSFFKVMIEFNHEEKSFNGEWRVNDKSIYNKSPKLYKDNGFKEKKTAQELIDYLNENSNNKAVIVSIEKKTEKKNPPLLFNLAELQNECSKLFKISPDETLKHTQTLYEKKLVTYPRTDARVLSTAVSKEIYKNIQGLMSYSLGNFAKEVYSNSLYKGLEKTRYVNDSQITDHYAIIPTGQGLRELSSLQPIACKIYDIIVKRFLSIFYPPAIFKKISIVSQVKTETFYSNFKVLVDMGYFKITGYKPKSQSKQNKLSNDNEEEELDMSLFEIINKLKKGQEIKINKLFIKEGETQPPKRYNSGSMILAMENAGQLIEDDELRAQIKSSGIGTSATRAEILNKLMQKEYLSLNKKTQVIMPTKLGEMIFEVVNASIKSLLNPELTASWEKGLNYVADGKITEEEYMNKLENFVTKMTNGVKGLNNSYLLNNNFRKLNEIYKNSKTK